jgi:adenosylcobyric acid synthase
MARKPALMFQGTGSDVGKSLLVAGLCRALANRGMAVAPFKPQNMSNNAAVTADGGEIGRAQALQARAARVPASVHMNPVLLKPEGEMGSQLVVQGERRGSFRAAEYQRLKAGLMPEVMASFAAASAEADIVLVEGAGSPAEVNLRDGDIANMGFAEAAGIPVALVGDVDRGGVIASLVGTHVLLSEAEQRRIAGFIVNKFRGDVTLFEPALGTIAKATGWESFGVVPWFDRANLLPAEDGVALQRMDRQPGKVTIAVPLLPRIANFDDLDPLRQEADVAVIPVRPGEPLPVADCVLLPGSKATLADLAILRQQGWDIDILAHRRRGGFVVGLCGGYQMLGRRIADPEGIEGPPGAAGGLGLLAVNTTLTSQKVTRPVSGKTVAGGTALSGYEIHAGETVGADCARPFADLGASRDGATSADGRVIGTYVHGIFAGDAFRREFVRMLGGLASDLAYERQIEDVLDALAAHVERHLAVDRLLSIAERSVA